MADFFFRLATNGFLHTPRDDSHVQSETGRLRSEQTVASCRVGSAFAVSERGLDSCLALFLFGCCFLDHER